jgi:hypothetical protein
VRNNASIVAPFLDWLVKHYFKIYLLGCL